MAISRDLALRMLNEYKKKECLWNFKCALYKRLDIKNQAWREIAQVCGIDVDNVKKKIKHMRTAYVAEKKKVEASAVSGASAEVYEPTLFYYEEMRFLNPAILLRKSEDNLEKISACDEPAMEQEASMLLLPEGPVDEIDMAPPEDSVTGSDAPRRKRRSEAPNKYNDAIEEILRGTITPQKSIFQKFSDSIASQLETMPRVEAIKLMAEIQSKVSSTAIALIENENLIGNRKENLFENSKENFKPKITSTPTQTKPSTSSELKIISNVQVKPPSLKWFKQENREQKTARKPLSSTQAKSNIITAAFDSACSSYDD